MTPRRLAVALPIVVAFAFADRPALAQSANAQAAEGLFQEGLSLLEAGKTAEACGKFVASYQLDPANGTLQNVASCHEKEGKTASSWSEWLELAGKAGRAGQKEREALARSRAAELSRDLARLELRFGAASSDVGAIEVDGQPLARSAWSTPLPLDPGPHALVFKGSGKKDATAKVTMTARSNAVVEVPKLEDEALKPATGSQGAREGSTSEHAADSRRTLGFVIGGAGVVAVGIGGFFGLRAISQKDDAACDGRTCPTQDAVDLRDSAKTSATISTIALGFGLGFLGVGAYLVLSAGKTPTKSAVATTTLQPLLGPDVQGVRWTARW